MTPGGPSRATASAEAPPRPKVAVVGAGAVGGYFGGLLARSGVETVLIGRESFVTAVNRQGLTLDTLTFTETVRVTATTELAAVRSAGIVLFCVKTTDTAATARALAPHLNSAALVVSLQNGAENAGVIGEITGRPAIPAIVYLAAAVPTPGTVKHTGRGDLIVGPDEPRVRGLAQLLKSAGIGCVVSRRIDDEIWEKLICNCALNAISALWQKTYGEIGRDATLWTMASAVVREALAVAQASGVNPTNMASEDEATTTVRRLTAQIAAAYSSTAQDLRRNRRTEIDALNGFIVRRGLDRGLPTPVNHALWTLVRTAEGPRESP